jgi:hypothetical protein
MVQLIVRLVVMFMFTSYISYDPVLGFKDAIK